MTDGGRAAAAREEPQPVWVVGVGARGPDGLTAEARERIAEADVLAGGRRHLALFPGCGAERLILEGGLAAIERIADLRARSRVVVLASGDPNLFGVAAPLRRRLGAEAVRVLPGVSSVQLAFARVGASWEDVRILSAHGRPVAGLLPAALGARQLAVLTDGVSTPGRVAAVLAAAGLEDCPAFVCERLGDPAERVVATSLRALADGRDGPFDPLNVLLLLRGAAPDPAAPAALAPASSGPAVSVPAASGPAASGPAPPEPAAAGPALFGRDEDEYRHDGCVTKAEVRAVALARLRLGAADLLWDVGAGCGSLSVEAAALCSRGAVYAVERRPDRADLLRANVRRFAAANVVVVPGEAPDCLGELPDPDAVFVGGSGGRLLPLLDAAAARLRPGGRLVANLATVESLADFRAWSEGRGWPAAFSQLSVARGADAGGRLRFAALNPVFVASVRRPPGSPVRRPPGSAVRRPSGSAVRRPPGSPVRRPPEGGSRP